MYVERFVPILFFMEYNLQLSFNRSTGNTLEELHRFFEDYPDDYRLEVEAEVRLKALYSCLVVRHRSLSYIF